ncbi:DUF1129 family protein [Carnobacteriaceae bacterium zg-ZUI78]|nr:DUF1129 family protein [Carnobacteriaceae bacterium zg-ZUI78]
MVAKKKEVIEHIDYAKENVVLAGQLTKRNEQYIHDLDKALSLANVSELDRQRLAYTMMQELIQNQKTGKTARQLYGTVAEQTKRILEGPKEDETKPSTDWKLFLDGGLLMGSFFMIMTGISANSQSLGIVSMLLNYVIMGLAMLVLTKASPKYQEMMKASTHKWVALFKYLMITILTMLICVLGIFVTSFIPAVINPVLDKSIYLIIGVITLGAKFYLKKKLNIRGGLF